MPVFISKLYFFYLIYLHVCLEARIRPKIIFFNSISIPELDFATHGVEVRIS